MKEIVDKVKEELEEKPLIVQENGVVYIGPHFKRYLRLQSRKDQKGRRGLSSRKNRVQKKIIQKQFEILIRKGLEYEKT